MAQRSGYGLRRTCVVALAVALLALGSTAFAESAREMFERAQGLAGKKLYAEAVEVMLDFQTKFPDDRRVPEAQFLVGRYQHQRNYLNAALKEYKFVIQDFPRTIYAAQAYRHVAEICVHMEDYEKAAESLETLSKKFEGSLNAFHGLRELGEVYLRMKDEDQAVGAFSRLIQYNVIKMLNRNPREMHGKINADIRRGVFFLANRAIEAKDYDAAAQAYTRLPEMWEKVRLMIDLLYRQDKLGEIHDLVRSMEGKDYWKAQNILLEFYCRRQATQGLLVLIRKVTEEHEQCDELTALFKHFLAASRRMENEKKRMLFELVATRYRPVRREFEYAICGMVQREEPDTLNQFIATYEKGTDVEQCKRWRGVYFEGQKDRERAQEEYWRMTDKAAAHFYVAESYHGEYARAAKNVDLPGAVKEYMEIRKRFYNTEKTCEAYWRMGHLYAEMGKKEDAVKTLTELEKRFVGQPDWQVKARYQIAEWERGWKQYKEAIMSYRSVDRGYPKTGQQQWAVYNIGLCYEGLNDKDKAVRAFMECIRRFPQTKVQSDAHTRLEVKYKIPDLQIHDMMDDD